GGDAGVLCQRTPADRVRVIHVGIAHDRPAIAYSLAGRRLAETGIAPGQLDGAAHKALIVPRHGLEVEVLQAFADADDPGKIEAPDPHDGVAEILEDLLPVRQARDGGVDPRERRIEVLLPDDAF